MAQKVQVLLIDDIDGGEATETVKFGLDGTPYEIDLSSANAGTLRAELAQYVEHARKTGGGQAQGNSGLRRNHHGPSTSLNGVSLGEIRAWARKQGHRVKDRGRIAASIVAEYQATH